MCGMHFGRREILDCACCTLVVGTLWDARDALESSGNCGTCRMHFSHREIVECAGCTLVVGRFWNVLRAPLSGMPKLKARFRSVVPNCHPFTQTNNLALSNILIGMGRYHPECPTWGILLRHPDSKSPKNGNRKHESAGHPAIKLHSFRNTGYTSGTPSICSDQ